MTALAPHITRCTRCGSECWGPVYETDEPVLCGTCRRSPVVSLAVLLPGLALSAAVGAVVVLVGGMALGLYVPFVVGYIVGRIVSQ